MTANKQRPPAPIKEWLALRLLQFSAVLPLPLSRALGAVIGRCGALLQSRSYLVTLKNLELCFPAMPVAERRQIARLSLAETGKMLLETGSIWLREIAWVNKKILRVHNQSLLDAALASNRGVVLLAPHLGNWEVLGLYLAQVSNVTSLYQPPDMPQFETIIRQSREKSGAKLVPTNRRGVMALLKALKAGELTAILPDQVPDKKAGGSFAPFFGQPALTMTLVHNLLRSANCVALAGYAQRVPGGFEIHFLEADAEIYSVDPALALAAMNRAVEQCVLQIPEQYQWEYKRFRKQPDNKPNPYSPG
ncbi:lysophospholipid acyltransferase family protein [Pseudomaricurvus alcaniphilus]|uniref:lysophospholipid acyltransferase family protein n=1 Tax=Pseudomaricurvus alcaniphilus TaxID=1166482 RepID=UPI001409DA4D|nr:lysophospholipid acyltransferase family protein [Pseudomaricurvus alcaniphilus]NHN38819.1 lysophospholipid acyltransferase family protein [Pseudomaricurvus alcaniphilus]